jgi:hypothetical protein
MLGCMARESREVWAERVKRWRESGQSAQEFAAAMGFWGVLGLTEKGNWTSLP